MRMKLRGLRQRMNLAIGRAIHRTGFDVRRVSRDAEHSMLGLRNRDIRTVLDVGANAGQFARFALERFPRARIFAFEPLPGAFSELAALAASEPRVEAINAAIGESEGEAEMFEHTSHTFTSSLLPTTASALESLPAMTAQRRIRVPVTTLDRTVAGRDLGPGILVKIDVQGYEDRVLRGAVETLRRAEASIIEVNLDAAYAGQASFRDILAGMESAGLRFAGALDQVTWPDGHVSHFDALFLRPRA